MNDEVKQQFEEINKVFQEILASNMRQEQLQRNFLASLHKPEFSFFVRWKKTHLNDSMLGIKAEQFEDRKDYLERTEHSLTFCDLTKKDRKKDRSHQGSAQE